MAPIHAIDAGLEVGIRQPQGIETHTLGFTCGSDVARRGRI